VFRTLQAVFADAQGQGLAEYAVILGFVSAASVVVLAVFGGNIKTALTGVSNDI